MTGIDFIVLGIFLTLCGLMISNTVSAFRIASLEKRVDELGDEVVILTHALGRKADRC